MAMTFKKPEYSCSYGFLGFVESCPFDGVLAIAEMLIIQSYGVYEFVATYNICCVLQ